MQKLAILLLFFTSTAIASPVDSLENLLKTAKGADRVKVWNELFRAYINSNPVKAVEYTRQALSLATSIPDEKGMAACYNNLGVAYRNQGALDLSVANYMRALDLYSRLGNGEGVATVKNNLGTVYSMKKNYAEALTFFESSHQGFVALGQTDKIIGSMNNLGNLHSDLQLYDKAITFFTDAWKMSEKAGLKFADPLTNIGNLYYRQGNYQRAVEFYEQGLEIVRKQNDRRSEMIILANMGELFEKAAQPAKAQNYLDESLKLAAELEANFILPQVLKSMASNYARQGKMKEAYETFLKYDGAREKVYGEESSRRIAQMDVALELKEKEDEIESLTMTDQVKTLKLRNAQIIIITGVLGLISAIAVFNLMYSKRKKRAVTPQ